MAIRGAELRNISTHAPRTGSDRLNTLEGALQSDFNPRSPHGERQFPTVGQTLQDDFNPRSPHGERRFRHLRP